MATPIIKVSSEQLRRKMEKYERVVGKEVRQLVHNSARLCCVELARFTQPYGTDKAARASGEETVNAGIESIFRVVDTKFDLKRFKAAETQRKISNIAEAKTFHQSNRSRSTGRTFRKQWKDRGIIQQSLLLKLIKETQKRVGLAKSGWASVALLCRADVRAPLRGIPQWVTRNMASRHASVDDRAASGFGWVVKLRNRIKYTSRVISPSNILIATNVAKKKMIGFLNAGIRSKFPRLAGL